MSPVEPPLPQMHPLPPASTNSTFAVDHRNRQIKVFNIYGDFNHWSKELPFCQGCGCGGGIPANALEDPLLFPPGLTIDDLEQNIVVLEKTGED